MSANPELLALESTLRSQRSENLTAKLFVTAVRAVARHKHSLDESPAFRIELKNNFGGMVPDFVEKAGVPAIDLDELWLSAGGRELSTAYLATLQQSSLLDALAPYALPIPVGMNRVFVGSAAVASFTAEAAPKVCTSIDLTAPDAEPSKAAGIIVMTNELLRATSGQARTIFEIELKNALVRAFNERILSLIPTTHISPTGSALGDLKAGLAAAAASSHYVVAMGPAQVRELAFDSEGRMGVGGGEFLTGVSVVPVDAETSAGSTVTVIPADRMALSDYGLVIRASKEGSIMMSDSPSSPAELVSMWQTNSTAILAERMFRLIPQANAVEVG